MDVLVMMAMEAEALPIVDALELVEVESATSGLLPSRWFADERTTVVINGRHRLHGVDSIGTTAAAIATLAAVTRLEPSWIVSAGTAGGFAQRGGHIGQVVVAQGPVIHHDRRIPLAGFDEYGRGNYPTEDLDEVADRLGFTTGPCSTGDSLDAPESDLAVMATHGTLAKDMEAAAVAHVAWLADTPFTALKVITDLVDGPEPTAAEFLSNLESASATLATALPRLVEELHSYRRDRPS